MQCSTLKNSLRTWGPQADKSFCWPLGWEALMACGQGWDGHLPKMVSGFISLYFPSCCGPSTRRAGTCCRFCYRQQRKPIMSCLTVSKVCMKERHNFWWPSDNTQCPPPSFTVLGSTGLRNLYCFLKYRPVGALALGWPPPEFKSVHGKPNKADVWETGKQWPWLWDLLAPANSVWLVTTFHWC